MTITGPDARSAAPGQAVVDAAMLVLAQPSTRRAVAGKRLAEINHAAATTGDDPELDTLLLRLHTETACRRGGALGLRPQDLDPEQCLILLREKGETVRWQPVSPTLMAALLGHAGERHAPADGQLLRYRNGRRITYHRYDHLWDCLGRYLPWVSCRFFSASRWRGAARVSGAVRGLGGRWPGRWRRRVRGLRRRRGGGRLRSRSRGLCGWGRLGRRALRRSRRPAIRAGW